MYEIQFLKTKTNVNMVCI